jgi:hypothetical protein
MKTLGKSLTASKTFWVNLLTIIAYLLNNYFGWIGLPEEYVVVAVAFINLILRLLTGQPIKRAI